METLHPLFVHFPIALLTLYACIELFSLFIKKWREDNNLFVMKLLLLIIGSLGSSLASNSGEAAKHAMEMRTLLVERHEFFAGMSTSIFWGLTIFYIIKWALSEAGQQYSLIQKLSGTVKAMIEKLILFIESYYLLYLGALAGFIALSITGALGGAIVHGTQTDIIVERVVKIVGI